MVCRNFVMGHNELVRSAACCGTSCSSAESSASSSVSRFTKALVGLVASSWVQLKPLVCSQTPSHTCESWRLVWLVSKSQKSPSSWVGRTCWWLRKRWGFWLSCSALALSSSSSCKSSLLPLASSHLQFTQPVSTLWNGWANSTTDPAVHLHRSVAGPSTLRVNHSPLDIKKSEVANMNANTLKTSLRTLILSGSHHHGCSRSSSSRRSETHMMVTDTQQSDAVSHSALPQLVLDLPSSNRQRSCWYARRRRKQVRPSIDFHCFA